MGVGLQTCEYRRFRVYLVQVDLWRHSDVRKLLAKELRCRELGCCQVRGKGEPAEIVLFVHHIISTVSTCCTTLEVLFVTTDTLTVSTFQYFPSCVGSSAAIKIQATNGWPKQDLHQTSFNQCPAPNKKGTQPISLLPTQEISNVFVPFRQAVKDCRPSLAKASYRTSQTTNKNKKKTKKKKQMAQGSRFLAIDEWAAHQLATTSPCKVTLFPQHSIKTRIFPFFRQNKNTRHPIEQSKYLAPKSIHFVVDRLKQSTISKPSSKQPNISHLNRNTLLSKVES